MADITRIYNYTNGTTANGSELCQEFNQIIATINDLGTENIAASAITTALIADGAVTSAKLADAVDINTILSEILGTFKGGASDFYPTTTSGIGVTLPSFSAGYIDGARYVVDASDTVSGLNAAINYIDWNGASDTYHVIQFASGWTAPQPGRMRLLRVVTNQSDTVYNYQSLARVTPNFAYASKYLKEGARLYYATATMIKASAGQIAISNQSSGDVNDFLVCRNTAVKTVDISTTEYNDNVLVSGALAANTIYYVYAVPWERTGFTLRISAAATGLSANGYPYNRLIGSFKTNAEAATIIPFEYEGGWHKFLQPVRNVYSEILPDRTWTDVDFSTNISTKAQFVDVNVMTAAWSDGQQWFYLSNEADKDTAGRHGIDGDGGTTRYNFRDSIALDANKKIWMYQSDTNTGTGTVMVDLHGYYEACDE